MQAMNSLTAGQVLGMLAPGGLLPLPPACPGQPLTQWSPTKHRDGLWTWTYSGSSLRLSVTDTVSGLAVWRTLGSQLVFCNLTVP